MGEEQPQAGDNASNNFSEARATKKPKSPQNNQRHMSDLPHTALFLSY